MNTKIKIRMTSFLLVLLCAVSFAASETEAQRRRRVTRTTPASTTTRFIVPDDTRIEARLNTSLSTKTARNGTPFTARVEDPNEYNGATLYGTVSGVQRGGRVKGRSTMTLNFNRIRLANGATYRFDGTVESIEGEDGTSARVGSEGEIEEAEARGETTAKRGGIGAGAGALIGAIAGGGKGAAIGAIVGGGAGAGSVYVQGRDDLELNSGTRLQIRASAPRGVR